ISPKEQLDADITMTKAEADGWFNRLISETLHDTSGYTQESLAGLLGLRQRASNDYIKVIGDYETGNAQSGLNSLESIPALYGYNEQQLSDHNKFTEYYQLLVDAQLNIKPVQHIDSIEAYNLANQIIDISCLPDNWLRNSLLAAGKLNYTEQYILPDLTKSEITEIPKNKSKTDDEYIKLFPNPAKDFLFIEYKVSNSENRMVVITDIKGKQVDQVLLPKTADQMIYDTKKLIAGSYNCSLYINNDRKSSVTFFVLH
ncbi:MAG: T9SS type A sorting domain-containing protein, partial [Bacteroidota bacterium]